MDTEQIKKAIESTWGNEPPSAKAKPYIGKFFERTITGEKIVAEVDGNYGVYTVSIDMKSEKVTSACSCYIGDGGFCHHCEALALTYLNEPESFKTITYKTRKQVRTLADLKSYLQGKTLEDLFLEMKELGITQKDFAGAIGMSTRRLSSIKSSELRNHYYSELGATKVACQWVIDHFNKRQKAKERRGEEVNLCSSLER
jgi:hypothetical protein